MTFTADRAQAKITDVAGDELLLMPVGDGLVIGINGIVVHAYDTDHELVYVGVQVTPDDFEEVRRWLNKVAADVYLATPVNAVVVLADGRERSINMDLGHERSVGTDDVTAVKRIAAIQLGCSADDLKVKVVRYTDWT